VGEDYVVSFWYHILVESQNACSGRDKIVPPTFFSSLQCRLNNRLHPRCRTVQKWTKEISLDCLYPIPYLLTTVSPIRTTLAFSTLFLAAALVACTQASIFMPRPLADSVAHELNQVMSHC